MHGRRTRCTPCGGGGGVAVAAARVHGHVVAALGQPVGQQPDVPLDAAEAGDVGLLAHHRDPHAACALRSRAGRRWRARPACAVRVRTAPAPARGRPGPAAVPVRVGLEPQQRLAQARPRRPAPRAAPPGRRGPARGCRPPGCAISGRALAIASSTTSGQFSGQRDGTTTARRLAISARNCSPPVWPRNSTGARSRSAMRLQRGALRPVTGDRTRSAGAGRGLDQRLHALLVRQPAQVQHVGAGLLAGRELGGIDAVGDGITRSAG